MFASLLTESLKRLEQVEPTTIISMTDQERDFELVRRMARGDKNALTELYAAYGQRLFAYALRLVADPALAEDVLQDVLVIAWRSAGRFRGEGRVAAWLLGIVHHTTMKALRRKPQPIPEAVEESMTAPGPSPEEIVQKDEQARWVREGLQSLSPDHRAVLELVFYQELSLSEAAEVCGCPVGTIKSRLSYARQHLRGVLSLSAEVEDWR